MFGYYILIGAIALVSWLVSNQLKRKFAHYSKVQLRNGMSGREIAEKMLADNGIYDVEVISTPGQLTDHYDPSTKTINLSQEVYHGANVAAAAVAGGWLPLSAVVGAALVATLHDGFKKFPIWGWGPQISYLSYVFHVLPGGLLPPRPPAFSWRGSAPPDLPGNFSSTPPRFLNWQIS